MEEASFLNKDKEVSRPYFNFTIPEARKNLVKEFDSIKEEPTNEPVKVYLRLKPNPENPAFAIVNSCTLATKAPACKNELQKVRFDNHYTFTKILPENATQEDVFDICVVEPLLNFISGYNYLFFAYGTSSAGKTFTMQGDKDNPGLVPRALHRLFIITENKQSNVENLRVVDNQVVAFNEAQLNLENLIRSNLCTTSSSDNSQEYKSSLDCTLMSYPSYAEATFAELEKKTSKETLQSLECDSTKDLRYAIFVSYAEIHNENVYDLLVPEPDDKSQKKPILALSQDKDGHVYIRNLKHFRVKSFQEVFELLMYGQHNLQFAKTGLNATSSRSHSIFTIALSRHADSDNPTQFDLTKFTFCDLAGAERAKKTHNVGERLKESSNINTSLLTLSRCINTLRNNQKKNLKDTVPFRESKITMLFRQFLLGHGRVSMIVNINQEEDLFDETVHALEFSAIARKVALPREPERRRKVRESQFFFYMANEKAKKRGTTAENGMAGETSAYIESLVAENSALKYSNEEYEKENKALRQQNERYISERNFMQREIVTLQKKQVSLSSKLLDVQEENSRIEHNVRNELADYFADLMQKNNARWEERTQQMDEDKDDLHKWRMNRLEEYYQQKLKRRRTSVDSSDEEDDDWTEMENKLKELEEKNKTLQKEIEKMNGKMVGLQTIITELKKERDVLKSTNSNLKFKQSQDLEKIQNLSDKLENLNKLLQTKEDCDTELRDQLQTLSEAKSKCEAEVMDLKVILESAQTDFKNYEEEIRDLESEILFLKQEMVEEKNKREEFLINNREQVMRHGREIESLQNEIKKLTKQQAAKEEENQEKQKKISQLIKQLAAVEEENQEKQKEISQLIKQLDVIEEEKRKEISQLIKQLDVIEEENQEKQEEISQLTKQLDVIEEENQKKQKEISQLIKQLAAIEEENQEKQKEISRLTEISEKLKKLETDTKVWKEQVAEKVLLLETEKENMRKEIRKLEIEKDELSSIIDQQEEDCKNEQTRHKQQFDTYESLLVKERKEVEIQKKENQRLLQQMNITPTHTKGKLIQLQNDYDTVLKENEHLRRKAQRLEDKVKNLKLERDLACPSSKVSEIEEELRSLDLDNGELRSSSRKVMSARTRRTVKKIGAENVEPGCQTGRSKSRDGTCDFEDPPCIGTRRYTSRDAKTRARKNLYSMKSEAQIDSDAEVEVNQYDVDKKIMAPLNIIKHTLRKNNK